LAEISLDNQIAVRKTIIRVIACRYRYNENEEIKCSINVR